MGSNNLAPLKGRDARDMSFSFSIQPFPSGKKIKKSKKSKIRAKNIKNSRKKRANKTIAQCVVLSLQVCGVKRGLRFGQIKKCLLQSNVKISNFILKKTFKKLQKWKVVKIVGKKYKLTGKRCPRFIKNKELNKKRSKSKAQKKADRKFRARMARNAHKIARGGRTIEQCANDVLKDHKKMTMMKMLDYLNKHDVKVSKFVLKHVMKRLREKGVFKIYRGHYSKTGKRMPQKKKTRTVKKEKEK